MYMIVIYNPQVLLETSHTFSILSSFITRVSFSSSAHPSRLLYAYGRLEVFVASFTHRAASRDVILLVYILSSNHFISSTTMLYTSSETHANQVSTNSSILAA